MLYAQVEEHKTPTAAEKTESIDQKPVSEEAINLLNGADNPLKYWKFYSSDQQVKQEETFYISTNGDPKEPILVCKGKPFGYLRYEAECMNYDFNFEWKYAKDPNGNSGVLLHVAGDDKIWPIGMQIQLHRPTAGSIFPSGGAKSDNVLKVLEPPVKEAEWNTCEINCVEGKISVTINGKKQGEVTGCKPPSGGIALQSEGAEIHFRKLKLKKLTPGNTEPNLPKPEINQPTDLKPVDPQSKEIKNTTWHQKIIGKKNLRLTQHPCEKVFLKQSAIVICCDSNQYEELVTKHLSLRAELQHLDRKQQRKLQTFMSNK